MDRKSLDKPIIRPFSTDEAGILPGQKQVSKKESLDLPSTTARRKSG
jgi:hypothetical protein